jgi:hypothetical protein
VSANKLQISLQNREEFLSSNISPQLNSSRQLTGVSPVRMTTVKNIVGENMGWNITAVIL